MMLGLRREKKTLNHWNVVCPVHAQHELRRRKKAANRIGSFELTLDWHQCRFSHGLKSFSTSALLSLWGMVEAGVGCRILGAGQHLHLFSTVSGLEKTLWAKARKENTESLLPERLGKRNGSVTKTLNLETSRYGNKMWTILALFVKSPSHFW